MIELYQVTFNLRYLQVSLDLNEYLLNHFWDTVNDGLFFTANENERLLIRSKELYDGAIPSANSMAVYNLVRLARITGKTDLEQKAIDIGKAFSDQITRMPSAYTQFMIGLDFSIGPSVEIVVVGKKENSETQQILKEINSLYLPNKVVILKELDLKSSLIEAFFPFLEDYDQLNNQTTIYLCKNHQCQLPTTDIEKLKQDLNLL